ncbi:hypothetical protein CCR97_11835 [Rhodoplanes elegans]|uniref:DUF86 domain-containing protein n=1 Tax=Rhodoplanes elegans TaxID=29408 RepID=A0A327KLK4_9BRAD|nr:HepT-like ribonuclease domain-containing protein [Rhodoplanes elegans]MBK5958893.1 hypothetical protein [Rhodoplanes elegans]RAI38413.1 hypothetical protein CH338_12755 [Rhodoplanes elegans]
MSRTVRERLQDARAFADAGETHALGLDRAVFADVVEVKQAVYFCLIGLSEALKFVPTAVLDAEPTIPWPSIIGMRNRLVHTYWRIDDDIVYDVVTLELSPLSKALGRLLAAHSGP